MQQQQGGLAPHPGAIGHQPSAFDVHKQARSVHRDVHQPSLCRSCVALRLVIEIDGEAHDRSDRPDFDDTRDQWMRGQGYNVIRFSARDIVNNLDGAVLAIRDAVATPLHHPSDGPPPRSGEEF